MKKFFKIFSFIRYIFDRLTGFRYKVISPLCTKDEYLEIFQTAKNREYKTIKNYFSYDYNKIKIWIDDLALVTQVVKKQSDINYQHGFVLYQELMKYIKKNQFSFLNILETGTARGFSSIVMAKVLTDIKQDGQINTIDIIPPNIKMYWNCILDHDGKKTRYELLKGWEEQLKIINFLQGDSIKIMQKLPKKRINFCFLDGAHSYKKVKNEFKIVSVLQKPGDIIIFDDVTKNYFNGVVQLVNEINEIGTYNIELLTSDKAQRGYAVAKKK